MSFQSLAIACATIACVVLIARLLHSALHAARVPVRARRPERLTRKNNSTDE